MKIVPHIHTASSQKLSLLLLAIALAIVSFFVQGNIDLNLWDEGFFWYGAQRVMLGEVPIRDFMAYDPGRYYWAATIMKIVGDDGIVSLRISSLVLQALALFVGLSLVSQALKKQDFIFILISAITMLMWMFLSYKMADYAVSIFLVAALTFLIQNPTAKRYFMLGLCVGFAAFFGRNHGVYGILGSLSAFIWLRYKHQEGCATLKGFAFWGIGVVVGFMPMLLMIVFVPGYAQAFWQSVLILFQIKDANLAVAVPWPWLTGLPSLSTSYGLRAMFIGVFFVGLLVFGLASISFLFWRKPNNNYVPPVFVASAFLALPYAHYAYLRADIHHLSFAVYPLLLGCFALLASQRPKVKWSLLILLSTVSIWVTCAYNPGWQCYKIDCVSLRVSGKEVWVSPVVAKDVALIKNLTETYAKGQNFIVTPFWPGAYSLLNRKSPMWGIYALLPRGEAYEKAEIERIKNEHIKMALITDILLDGREDLLFKNTHPMVYQYIVDNFDKLPNIANPNYHVYIAKPLAQ